MAIDMTQFHQTFFEESLEGMEEMESHLLAIEETMAGRRGTDLFEADKESLNTIFRAVHSIKGGSATFGFNQIASFAHILETLLDDLREGRCPKTRHVVNVLLQSVDCLRGLLEAARTDSPVDEVLIEGVRAALKKLQQDTGSSSSAPVPLSDDSTVSSNGWKIHFMPQADMLKSGNDPLRIIRALSSHGKIKVKIDNARLPAWENIDPEASYLSWIIELHGDVSRKTVMDAFAWVIGDCELEVTPLDEDRPQISGVETAQNRAQISSSATQSIRISTSKADDLVNLVGELVITQTMLSRFEGELENENIDKLMENLGQLERNTRDLQESVMSMRMLPIGFAFNKLPRMVRDVSQQLGKKVELKVSGESTELDKTVIERVGDSLLHLVRNCVDHGLEVPKERKAAGKPETGTIHLRAYQEGGNVIIEIEDDGKGLQREKILAKAIERGLVSADADMSEEQIDQIIFIPGFSTADQVTDVSGRGVGTDAVRTNIRALRGNVEVVTTPGKGTKFTLRLPLTLAIMDGLTVRVGSHVYILPMLNIVESVSVTEDQITRPGGSAEKFVLRKTVMPLTRLYDLFQIRADINNIEEGIVVVVEAEGKKAGIFVDELLGQQQVVVKSLEEHHRKVEGVATATILGDGEVALILDVTALVRLSHTQSDRPNLRKAG